MASIYTKTGDKGETGLVGGDRVEKDDLRVECYGTMDEVISILGIAYSLSENEEIKKYIRWIQEKQFIVGAELASKEKGLAVLKNKISLNDIKCLESIIDECIEEVGAFTGFVTPGVNQVSATLHHARTVVRRAERNIIRLAKEEDVRSDLKRYVNRLSDAIYALARLEEHTHEIKLIKEEVIKRVKGRLGVMKVDLNSANELAKYAEEKAKEINVPIVVAVVDNGGNIVLVHRMDETLLGSIDIAINKAYTANAIKVSTDKLGALAQPGESLYGIQNTNNGKIVIFGGGYPLYQGDKVVGAIGISGGTVPEDMEIAEYAINKVKGGD